MPTFSGSFVKFLRRNMPTAARHRRWKLADCCWKVSSFSSRIWYEDTLIGPNRAALSSTCSGGGKCVASTNLGLQYMECFLFDFWACCLSIMARPAGSSGTESAAVHQTRSSPFFSGRENPVCILASVPFSLNSQMWKVPSHGAAGSTLGPRAL